MVESTHGNHCSFVEVIPKKKGCRSKMLKTLLVSILAVVALALPTATAEATNVEGRNWHYNNGWTLVNAQNQVVTGWYNGGTITEPIWFLFNNAGRLQTGWQQVGNQWFFLQNNGTIGQGLGVMLTGPQTIGGRTFYLRSNGAMATGWANGYRLYHATGGHQLFGWQRVGTQWFYLDAATGVRQGNGSHNRVTVTTSHPGVYLFHNGVMQTGWTNVGGGNWTFSARNGRLQHNVWRRASGHWYHIGADGYMTRANQGDVPATGIINITNTAGGTGNNGWFAFDNNGRMRTGWFNTGGHYYFANASGRIVEGWHNSGQNRFFLRTAATANGAPRFSMAVGPVTIDGIENVFAANGRWLGTTATPETPGGGGNLPGTTNADWCAALAVGTHADDNHTITRIIGGNGAALTGGVCELLEVITTRPPVPTIDGDIACDAWNMTDTVNRVVRTATYTPAGDYDADGYAVPGGGYDADGNAAPAVCTVVTATTTERTR